MSLVHVPKNELFDFISKSVQKGFDVEFVGFKDNDYVYRLSK